MELIKEKQIIKKTTKRRGFSLVEIFVTITIIGILSGTVFIKNYNYDRKKTYYVSVQNNLKEIARALQQYSQDMEKTTGTMPSTEYSTAGTGITTFTALNPYLSKPVQDMGRAYKTTGYAVYYTEPSNTNTKATFNFGEGNKTLEIKWRTVNDFIW